LKEWERNFGGFKFLRKFSYPTVWFTGKGKEAFHRIRNLQLNSIGKTT